MQHYILYHTDTGKIESVLQLSEGSKQKMLDKNTNIAFLTGTVSNVNKFQVNVSADPHVIENKPDPVVNVTEYIREYRRVLLKDSDWTQAIDSPLSDSKKTQWATYRQALRDLPTTNSASDPDSVVWPTRPS